MINYHLTPNPFFGIWTTNVVGWFLIVIFPPCCSTIGSTVIYIIAWKLGRAALLRYLKYARINEKKLTKVECWFEKYGDKAVFFGRLLPVIREMISIPAGVLKMKISKFLLYTFLGSCVYSTGVILAGYYFGITVFENI